MSSRRQPAVTLTEVPVGQIVLPAGSAAAAGTTSFAAAVAKGALLETAKPGDRRRSTLIPMEQDVIVLPIVPELAAQREEEAVEQEIMGSMETSRNLSMWDAAPWREKVYAVAEPGSFPSDVPHMIEKLSYVNSAFMLCIIAISCVAVLQDSYPQYMVSPSEWQWVVIEAFAVSVFSLDFLVRLFTIPRVGNFLRDPMNYIDLVAIFPFYVELIFSVASVSWLRMLRVLRLARLIRVLKTANVLGLASVLEAVQHSFSETFLFFVVSGTTLLIYASAFYFAERGTFVNGTWYRDCMPYETCTQEPSPVQSIPDAFWYTIVTMGTVGFGDVYPKTVGGRILGAIIMLSGVLVIAFPTMILSGHYEASERLKNAINNTWEAIQAKTVKKPSARVVLMRRMGWFVSDFDEDGHLSALATGATRGEKKDKGTHDTAKLPGMGSGASGHSGIQPAEKRGASATPNPTMLSPLTAQLSGPGIRQSPTTSSNNGGSNGRLSPRGSASSNPLKPKSTATHLSLLSPTTDKLMKNKSTVSSVSNPLLAPPPPSSPPEPRGGSNRAITPSTSRYFDVVGVFAFAGYPRELKRYVDRPHRFFYDPLFVLRRTLSGVPEVEVLYGACGMPTVVKLALVVDSPEARAAAERTLTANDPLAQVHCEAQGGFILRHYANNNEHADEARYEMRTAVARCEIRGGVLPIYFTRRPVTSSDTNVHDAADVALRQHMHTEDFLDAESVKQEALASLLGSTLFVQYFLPERPVWQRLPVVQQLIQRSRLERELELIAVPTEDGLDLVAYITESDALRLLHGVHKKLDLRDPTMCLQDPDNVDYAICRTVLARLREVKVFLVPSKHREGIFNGDVLGNDDVIYQFPMSYFRADEDDEVEEDSLGYIEVQLMPYLGRCQRLDIRMDGSVVVENASSLS